ncbi:MAG TPA: DUF4255 domain-containing protein, partial [Clostridia bacterium]|nr:DUF4255 domain-containing protein [Clostridia bacterium]
IMGRYTVISDVGSTLVNLLRENMVPEPVLQPEMIGLASPADKGDLRLSLFLYNIVESGDLRNNQLQVSESGLLQYPPMSLNLYYMLTAYSSSELSSRALDEQRILGKAMQVFFDNSIIRGSALQGTLREKNEEVKIVMDNIPVDILIKLWNFPNIPYKLSVSYLVGPIYLDSTRTKQTKRVMEINGG